MRDTPEIMDQRWRSGDYIGDARPMARLTIQQTAVKLYEVGVNTWSSIVFDNTNTPLEITAVKSVRWDRGVDNDTASATIEIWNTDDLALGEQPQRPEELDLPGIYTYPLDGDKYGRLPDPIAALLQPDNIIRTYEGYGFDPEVCADKDPNLVSTGVWLIDDIEHNITDGIITLKCRDLARILIDQICYRPVIPAEHYPLRFTPVGTYSGFRPPQLDLGIVDVTGYSSRDYDGPSDPPVITSVDEGDGTVTVHFDPPPFDPPQFSEPPEGYRETEATVYRAPSGYYVFFDDYDNFVDIFHAEEWYLCSGPGQVNAAIYLYGPAVTVTDDDIGPVTDTLLNLFGGASELEKYIPLHAPIGYTAYVSSRIQPIELDEDAREFTLTGLSNGNVYAVGVAAVWQHFESSAKNTGELASAIAKPNSGGPNVVVDSIEVVATGFSTTDMSWDHDGDASEIVWTIIQYQGYGEPGDFVRSYQRAISGAGTVQTTIPSALGDDNEYSYLVYGTQAGQVGQGWLLLAVQGDANFYQPPQGGQPPPFNYDIGGGQYTEDPDQVIPRDVVPIRAEVRSTSNWEAIPDKQSDALQLAKVPDAPAIEVNERTMANYVTDDDLASAWRSFNRPTQDSQVWVELDVPNITLGRVTAYFTKGPYMLYLSVYADGAWVSYAPGNTVPGGIPYLQAFGSPVEGYGYFWPQAPITNVTRVRLTMTNLAPSETAPGTYYALLRELIVEVPLVEINEAQDDALNTLEARVIGGAGDNPHTFEDFSDIVKLLCAWGGFFWPQDGTIKSCDGTEVPYNFGQAPYNLGDNIDPVLGADSGRVWGDFVRAGTASKSKLPIRQFDKRPLMDGINFVRNMLGFTFYIDEDGGVVWRPVNVNAVGNYVLNRSERAGFTLERVVLDERVNLLDYQLTVSSRNVRERLFVATTNGKHGAAVDGYNPNPTGLRRVAGWTDQHFSNDAECEVMASLLAIRHMFNYRVGRAQIPGYPKIQPNDQVQIKERQTQEDFLHFVSAISSSNDLVAGQWTYELTTHWLGTDPEDGVWAIDTDALAAEVLEAIEQQEAEAGSPLAYYSRGTGGAGSGD